MFSTGQTFKDIFLGSYEQIAIQKAHIMNFSEIEKLISKSFWLDKLHELKELTSNYVLTKRNFRKIVLNLTDLINKGRKGRALNWLILGLLLDQDKMIHAIKRDGIFRASRYGYDSGMISFLTKGVVKNVNELNLGPEDSEYFVSLDTLLSLTPEIRSAQRYIIKEIRSRRKTLVKDLLATLEILFMKGYRNLHRDKSSQIGFYFRGEISEAISYILYMYDDIFGIDNDCFVNMNEDAVLKFFHEDIVVVACKIKKYQEFEIDIDYFNYTCLDENGLIVITPPSDNFEKALQHGYVFNEIQSYNLFFSESPKWVDKALSIEGLVSNLYEKFSDVLIERKTEPVERFIFKLPVIEALTEMLNEEKFFFEEIMILTDSSKELFTNFDIICEFKIYNNLTFFDLLKIHRLFQFMRIFFCTHLNKFMKSEPEIVVRSLVPVYSTENISGILGIVIEEDKVQDFLDLFLWNPEKRRVLDLQYQPILSSGTHVIFPMHIYLFSNFLRNTLFAIKKRLHEPDSADPMSAAFTKLLKERFDRVEDQIEYDFSGYKGDIDIIAMKDNFVFIFECKRAMLSGDIFELRTIYDHITKGADQLSKIKTAFEDKDFALYMSQKLDWPFDDKKIIVTCIVMGNRMFSGYRCQDYPVRGFYELANFVYSGEILFKDGVFFQWRGDTFDPVDLYDYLENDSLHKLIFDCMFPKDIDYKYIKGTIRHKSFYTNYEAIFDKYKEHFKMRMRT